MSEALESSTAHCMLFSISLELTLLTVFIFSTCVPHLDLMKLSDDLIRTRGNQYKLIQHHCHYDLRKFNFTNRVISIWNSLTNHVVSADTVNCFKNRLDKFWPSQIVL